jgi:hypothetical protein
MFWQVVLACQNVLSCGTGGVLSIDIKIKFIMPKFIPNHLTYLTLLAQHTSSTACGVSHTLQMYFMYVAYIT